MTGWILQPLRCSRTGLFMLTSTLWERCPTCSVAPTGWVLVTQCASPGTGTCSAVDRKPSKFQLHPTELLLHMILRLTIPRERVILFVFFNRGGSRDTWTVVDNAVFASVSSEAHGSQQTVRSTSESSMPRQSSRINRLNGTRHLLDAKPLGCRKGFMLP
ncbi:uncharacterized protein LY79DRAFT_32400 [Colletotrichum navitas]|uniref:Uncharacterized protein n=1 Tax=Colletotrichum navitas TaxID=681940 RepID=A0AAD8V767_9PEZI|nr:uncharacterized protein LY79DRAFT_32400 [Colletotrichum navitas]KAK1596822.1 hypothetical protein LY79DRAFT_32400 [Colletotrichum navitas]